MLTLGLYRFWARTRLRRWYWSAIRPGGLPLEYTGSPYEKLLGFLIAVVILAFYIGVVNLVLLFVSFSILAAPGAAYGLTLLGVAPIWFFATYRAQRYLLARTRWRGIRFGLEPGAWAYALRACWHWALTLVTLGLWHPRMRFELARFQHDRTFYGTQRMAQGGGSSLLYPAFVHVIIGGVLTAGVLAELVSQPQQVMGLWDGPNGGGSILTPEHPPVWRLWFLSVPWLIYGLVHYSVEGRRMLYGALRVGNTTLDPRPSVGRVFWILTLGNILRYLSVLVIVGVAMAGLLYAAGAFEPGSDVLENGEVINLMDVLGVGLPQWAQIALTVALYFGVFLLWGALTHVLITMPLWRHYAQTLQLRGTGHLASVSQRDRDESREAGGFAEALDVGATI